MKKMAYVIVGVFVLSLLAMVPTAMAQEAKPVFKYGVSGDPETIDPAQAWDSASIDILDQVMEGLVAYDLFDPELSIKPALATDLGTWNAEATEVTFALRQDVTFHDGTPFNATAVKYTFDRLNWLIENKTSQIAELYEPLAQLYPTTPLVISEVVVVSEFTVKFILNYPYVAFTALLCFSGSYIVHYDMPFNRLIELDEELIGTGPYALDYYTEEETHFLAYEGYYLTQPEIQEMIWIKYDDSVALAQAFLAGDVDRPDSTHPDYIDEYQASPDIHVDPPKAGTCIYYMGMNNEIINKTWRQVISYSIDYDYIITNIMNNQVIRMKSPVPDGIAYHDPTVVVPAFNVKAARELIVDMGLNQGLLPTSADLSWYGLSESATPVASFNYTYNIGNRVRGDLGLLVKTNLKLVGVKVDIFGLTWPEYLERLLGDFDKLQLYMIGWCPDYNDPSNFINPLMSNTSLSNAAQVNDPWLQNAMMAALAEPNATARRELYSDIQHYIVEDLMPWVFLYTSVSVASWSVHLGNVPRNAMGKLYFYPCTWYSTTTTTGGETTTPPGFIPGDRKSVV